ncbi:MAG: translation elongation factor Ts [Sedimentisphaerales bacterium]
MAEISAALVMKLRKMSSQGMMDCKKALQESNGNLDEAMTILRKKGLATLAKRADREMKEGIVVCCGGETPTFRWASLATLCCETDFAAKSDAFSDAVDYIKNYVKECKEQSKPENLLNTEVNGKKYSEVVTDTVSKTGEKTEVCDYEKYVLPTSQPGLIATYVHFNGKIGVMVELETSTPAVADNPQFKLIARDICMHIAALNPLALDSSGISAETIERERAIAAEQVKNKPANIVEKIVDGKIKKFFADNCLLEQGFVKDEKVPVSNVLADAAKAAGGTAKIKRFVRFAIG